MRTGKISLTAVAGVLTLAVATGAFAGGDRVTGRYVGGVTGGLLPQSGPSFTLPPHPNIGGMWMEVPAGRSRLAVTVVDDFSDSVAADVQFVIGSYEPLVPSRVFCNSAGSLSIPPGAIALYVRVLVGRSLGCTPRGVPSMGTITAVFG